jgi:hypothetical protein
VERCRTPIQAKLKKNHFNELDHESIVVTVENSRLMIFEMLWRISFTTG